MHSKLGKDFCTLFTDQGQLDKLKNFNVPVTEDPDNENEIAEYLTFQKGYFYGKQ